MRGIAIASCCHSKTVWEHCTAQEFLITQCGISQQEFELMRRWAGMFTVDPVQAAADERRHVSGSRAINSSHWRDAAICSEDSVQGTINTEGVHTLSSQSHDCSGKNTSVACTDDMATPHLSTTDEISSTTTTSLVTGEDTEPTMSTTTKLSSYMQQEEEDFVGDELQREAAAALPELTFAERATLGRQCKRLIDFGRLHYIRTHLGLQVRLHACLA